MLLSKLATFTVLLGATMFSGNDLPAEQFDHHFIEKDHTHRGKRGKKGKKGEHGQQIQTQHIYASAILSLPPGSSSITFAADTPIPFSQILRANGVNAATPNSFIITTAGDYLITYYVNGGNSGFTNTDFSLLLNGAVVTSSIIGFQGGATISGTNGGDIILHLNVGDKIQLAPLEGSIVSTPAPSNGPVTVASLTIEKLNL